MRSSRSKIELRNNLFSVIFGHESQDDFAHASAINRQPVTLIFSSKRYMKLLNRYGLEPEYITPYSPEQNGTIERFMRTLKEECIWLNNFIKFRDAK